MMRQRHHHNLSKISVLLVVLLLCVPGGTVTGPKSAFASGEGLRGHLAEYFEYILVTQSMPADKQAARAEKIYREMFVFLQSPPPWANFLPWNRMSEQPEIENPQELAAWHAENSDEVYFFEMTQYVCNSVLETNLPSLKPLIEKELVSSNDDEAERALLIIGTHELVEFNQDVIEVFMRTENLGKRAAWTLALLKQYDSIVPLTKKSADPMEYSGAIASLQRTNPPHPVLLKLLESDQADIRAKTVRALSQSGHESLATYINKLVTDDSVEVRVNVIEMIGQLMRRGHKDLVYDDMVKLLADPDQRIRMYTVIRLARMRDAVCGAELLRLLKSSSLDVWKRASIYEALSVLTGANYRFSREPAELDPATEKNQAAIKELEAWLAKQP